jgi:acyl carrier protein
MTSGEDTYIEETLHRLIVKASHRDGIKITPTCTFKELGLDSLEVVHIIVSLEDIFDIDIVDEELKSINNMSALINYLKQKIAEKAT